MPLVSKQDMTEEEIKLNYITPAITARWDATCIRMELKVRDGRIIVDGKTAKRDNPSYADYVLFHNHVGQWFPLAIVEAKNNKSTVLGGMGQAKEYANAMDVPFAFSSNGDAFAMFDRLTGTETEAGDYIPMDQFPSPDELWARYQAESHISDAAAALLATPYYYQEGMHEPRYYQWIAINRVLTGVADGRKRMLIVLATGTGKTLIAFHIIDRLLTAKIVRRVLYIADRDVLLSQPMRDDFAPFGNKMYRIENRNMDTTHEVYLSLYHQMKQGEKNFYTAYDRDFFDLVIVDECHRGSADDDSSWHEILEYFDSAIQVGMTATPKETKDTSNIEYFNDGGDDKPLYTYSLKQGIADGFLAPYKVVCVNLDIDINGFRPYPGMKDINGNELPDKVFEQKDFDRILVVPERTKVVAKRISDYLRETDPFAKVIVFCEDIPHAERMVSALTNCNKELVISYPDYISQFTSGSRDIPKLEYFTDWHEKTPVIAVTSKLMSTGVNSVDTKVVALDRTIGSMTEFKQIIGRGTRVEERAHKLFFSILDFRKNYLKFADPAFDGEPVKVKEVGENDPMDNDDSGAPDVPETPDDPPDITYYPGNDGGEKPGQPDGPGKMHEPRTQYVVKGLRVEIINETVQYLDANGNLITTSIIEYSRRNLLKVYPYFDEFRKVWLANKKKDELLQQLVRDGVFIDYVRETIPRENVDDYDVLSYIGYDIPPLTKDERIDRILSSGYLDKYTQENQDIIKLLLNAYRTHDIDELTNIRILSMPEFVQKGTPLKIVNGFGGKESYQTMLNEVEEHLYGTIAG